MSLRGERWRIRGQVQGVGFRPFVYRLAQRHGLTGSVHNDTQGVVIDLFGRGDALAAMWEALVAEAPPLVRIDRRNREPLEDTGAPPPSAFRIVPSGSAGVVHAEVTVDAATCRDCLRELFDEADRRYRHPLINCTNCGPRYTIVQRVPYDRPNTTMSGFAMCGACAGEYRDAGDRRFHAQPVCCHDCGPRAELVDPDGLHVAGRDPCRDAAERLARGEILAIKGLGGFHLAAVADDPAVVRRLRGRKHRDAKPFAVMVASLDAARRLVRLSEPAAVLLSSAPTPIVLAPRVDDAAVAFEVAPGNHRLGVMLPTTPIQHLISRDPALSDRPLIMTSANLSDEPLVTDNADAVRRLGGLCDAILWHDRDIQRAVDDSVVLDVGDGLPVPIRRARGFVPAPLPLPAALADAPLGLATGGDLKGAIAITRDGNAILSQHLGDLDDARAYAGLEAAAHDLCELCGVEPVWIAHDLHPDYRSHALARERAARTGVPLVGVQHHHAHAASLMAEHGITERILAIVCDGTGFGTDGTIWGGELLACDLLGFQRLARLRPLRLPGGDAAARDISRTGLALLRQSLGADFVTHDMAGKLEPDERRRAVLARMLERGVNCPLSSGIGRLFDAVSALLGLARANRFEAEAALALEAAAASGDGGEALAWESFAIRTRAEGGTAPTDAVQLELDPAPFVHWLTNGIAAGTPAGTLAAAFHEALAEAWGDVAGRAARKTGIHTVGLSGGVFCNERLTRGLARRLAEGGLRVLRHERVPPNDGGLALGQAAIAAARVRAGQT